MQQERHNWKKSGQKKIKNSMSSEKNLISTLTSMSMLQLKDFSNQLKQEKTLALLLRWQKKIVSALSLTDVGLNRGKSPCYFSPFLSQHTLDLAAIHMTGAIASVLKERPIQLFKVTGTSVMLVLRVACLIPALLWPKRKIFSSEFFGELGAKQMPLLLQELWPDTEVKPLTNLKKNIATA